MYELDKIGMLPEIGESSKDYIIRGNNDLEKTSKFKKEILSPLLKMMGVVKELDLSEAMIDFKKRFETNPYYALGLIANKPPYIESKAAGYIGIYENIPCILLPKQTLEEINNSEKYNLDQLDYFQNKFYPEILRHELVHLVRNSIEKTESNQSGEAFAYPLGREEKIKRFELDNSLEFKYIEDPYHPFNTLEWMKEKVDFSSNPTFGYVSLRLTSSELVSLGKYLKNYGCTTRSLVNFVQKGADSGNYRFGIMEERLKKGLTYENVT